jgi:hypothetical protein
MIRSRRSLRWSEALAQIQERRIGPAREAETLLGASRPNRGELTLQSC